MILKYSIFRLLILLCAFITVTYDSTISLYLYSAMIILYALIITVLVALVFLVSSFFFDALKEIVLSKELPETPKSWPIYSVIDVTFFYALSEFLFHYGYENLSTWTFYMVYFAIANFVSNYFMRTLTKGLDTAT